MNETHERIYYVYGFVSTEHCPEICDEINQPSYGKRLFGGGFDENDVPHVWHGRNGISAIICTVDNEAFCNRSGDIKITNLAWMAPRVVQHQSVLEKAMKLGPILPLHYGTLFESVDRLDDFLAVHSNAIRNFLEEIEGKREWALQGYIDTKLCERAVLANMHKNEAAACALPHLAETFLEELEKREILDVVEKWTSGKCSELFESLMPLAINSSERRLLPHNGSVDGCEMVANWAFLIDEHGIDDFRALVERISKEFSEYGLSFHLSGPWPPYSFCPALDEE